MERRYADLLKRELIAQEQYDQFRTTAEALTATVRADAADVKSAQDTVMADEAAVKSAEETVRADQAVIDNARVQLSYATIRSPIDGRTGSLLLHEGNVGASHRDQRLHAEGGRIGSALGGERANRGRWHRGNDGRRLRRRGGWFRDPDPHIG